MSSNDSQQTHRKPTPFMGGSFTKLILIPIAIALLVGLSGATSNTAFNRYGIATGTYWEVNIFPTYNATVPFETENLFSTANSISTNVIPAYGVLSSLSYSYIAGYNTIMTSPGSFLYTRGYVNVGSNTVVDFAPTNASIYPSFYSCNSGFSTCIPVTGNLTANITSLTNKPNSNYASQLTIYLNPAGYFEYIVNQTSGLSSNPNLYATIVPGQLVYQTANLSKINSSVSSNAIHYGGSIFYSGLIDISPLEYEAQNSTLTVTQFRGFVYNYMGSFYNTSMFFNTKVGFWGGIYNWFANLWNNQNYATNCQGLKLNCPNVKNTTAKLQGAYEISISPEDSIPLAFAGINSTSLMNLSYAVPSSYCTTNHFYQGLCIESGISGNQGMTDFNTYFDTIYAPQYLMGQFLSIDVAIILGYAFLIVIVKKINGET